MLNFGQRLIVQNPLTFSGYGHKSLSFLSRPLLSAHVEALVADAQSSPAELAEIQLNQVKRLINFAYKQVPFWRNWIARSKLNHPDNFKILEDLRLISVTTKKVLRAATLKERSANNLFQYSRLDSTSGSTGEPFLFFLDIRGAERKTALALRGLGWNDAIFSNRIIRVRNRDLSLMVDGRHIKFSETADLDSILKALEEESAKDRFVLHSHASNLIILAEATKLLGANIKPGAILTTSEHCTPEQSVFLSEIFGCPVGDWYSSREVDSIASRCYMGSMHINTEQCVVEIVDEENNILPVGQRGQIILTSFNNYVMPFIRYAIGDRGIILKGPCLCGLPYPCLEFEGREINNISLPDGKTIHLFSLFGPFQQRADIIRQYQIIREGPWEFSITINTTRLLTNLEMQNLAADITYVIGSQAYVKVVAIDKLFSPGEKQIVYKSNYSLD